MQWGIKAGANLSTLTNSPDDTDTKFLPGFHAGLVTEYQLSEHFSLQPELLYSLQGVKTEVNFTQEDSYFFSKQTLKMGYLNLQVMAKYYAAPALSLEAGPQIEYLLSAKAD